MTRKNIFSRVDQLAQNDDFAQSILRAAALKFWQLAEGANWIDWRADDNDPDVIPPHWRAGADYVEVAVTAYVPCCQRLVRQPDGLEKYIDACVRGISDRAFEHKVLPHSCGTRWTSVAAKREFAQWMRNRLAMPLARMRAQSYQPTLGIIAPSVNDAGSAHIEIGERLAPRPNDTHAEDTHITPVDQRRDLLKQYKIRFNKTVKQFCKAADVDPSDLYKWINGKLKDTYKKSMRIEKQLRTPPPH